MEGKIWLRRAIVVMAAVALGAPALRADDAAAPGRAVRLNNVDGQVQVSQDGEVVADRALANTPLFQGSQVATGDDGRAEIQFDDGSVARIPPDSSVTLTVLKAGETEISLDSGMAYFELQDGQGNPTRVRLGTNLVTVSGFTVLRAKLDDGPAELAVFSGNAHVDGTDGVSVDVHGGQSLGMANMNVAESIEPDSWDAWNSDRDQAQTTADVASAPPTNDVANPNNPAWGDLNTGGTWYNAGDQGYVWSPYEAASPGWDPWAEGYWVWSPRYGYMWISVYSWGYLPYQCGIWNWYTSFGWGWAPGMCNTWWGGMGGGWIFNVGYMPTWYRLPVRPHPPRPINPRPFAPGHPVHHVPIFRHPVVPIIAVNRKDYSGSTPLPPRDPNHPVQIGSVIAQPVHPLPRTLGSPGTGFTHGGPIITKPPLNGPPTVGANPIPVPRPVYTPARPGYMPAPGYGGRPGYTPPPQPGGRAPGAGVAPSPRPAPGGTYRPPSAPSAPRPSGGGGGSRPAPSGGGGHPAPSGGGSHPTSSPHK